MKMDITHKRKLAAYLLSKDFFNDEKQIDDTQSTLIDIISVLNIPINEIKDIAKSIKNKGGALSSPVFYFFGIFNF